VLIKGTTLKVEEPLLVEVVLQLVDAKLVELLEVVDDELVPLEDVELVFEVEEEADERLAELEELMEVEELDFGAERTAYAPTPATTTITTTIKASARGAIPPLF
jgi:hypothetical protein